MSDLPSRSLLFACLSLALAGAHGCAGETLAIGGDAGAAGRGTSNGAAGTSGSAPGGTGPDGAAGTSGDAPGGTGPGGSGAGSAAECEDQERAVRRFLDANKACAGDSDCRTEFVGCGVTEDYCTGAVYVNQNTDTSELDRLRRTLGRCVSGSDSEGCSACQRAAARGACVSGLCQNGAAAFEPVQILRGPPEQTYWDLTVRGADLEEHEGKRVRVRVGMPDRPPERLGSGSALIESGAFELFFPSVWEAGLYKMKLVFIDVDDDGSCDPEQDKVFHDARASNAAELVVKEPGGTAQFDFHASSDPGKDCAAFNSSWPAQ